MKAEGTRLRYQWGGALEEWFVNDQRGLEHGFTVAERPPFEARSVMEEPRSDLLFHITTRGGLSPRIDADGRTVAFLDATGSSVLNYAGLKVWDADGVPLRAHFSALDPRHPERIVLAIDEGAARYPITVDPIAQQAYVKPAAVGATQVSDEFGHGVAVSGDTVVVGARFESSSTTGVNSMADEGADNAGAAYVFVRSGTAWSQQAYLKPEAVGTTQEFDQFGFSVGISGDTIVIGAPLEDSGTTGVDSTADESASGSGAAYVFVRNGTTWSQQAYLKPAAVGATQASDFFGQSVAVSGNTVVIGAPGEDSGTTGVDSTADEAASGSGAAYVFVRSGTAWSQQAYLKPEAFGVSQASDQFGFSVAVSDDTLVIGAPGEDSGTTGVDSMADEAADEAGAAYVFVRSGPVWSQQAYLKPAAVGVTQAGDRFGWSVAASGDTAVVGATLEDSNTTGVNSMADEIGTDSGAAYVFTRSGAAWAQVAYLKPAVVGTDQSNDQLGYSVAVANDTVIVGAWQESSSTTGVDSTPNEAGVFAGAAYAFTRGGATWVQAAYLKPAAVGTTQVLDRFGHSVGVSGSALVIGAFREDSSTTGVNSVANESGPESGAAYFFVKDLFADGFEAGNTSAWDLTVP